MSNEPVWTIERLSEETYRFRCLAREGVTAVEVEIVSAKDGEPVQQTAPGIETLASGDYRLGWRWAGGDLSGTFSSVNFTVPFEGKSLQLYDAGQP